MATLARISLDLGDDICVHIPSQDVLYEFGQCVHTLYTRIDMSTIELETSNGQSLGRSASAVVDRLGRSVTVRYVRQRECGAGQTGEARTWGFWHILLVKCPCATNLYGSSVYGSRITGRFFNLPLTGEGQRSWTSIEFVDEEVSLT